MIVTLVKLTIIFFFEVTFVSSKVYDKCQLAQELRSRDSNLFSDLSTWMCIVGKESSFNTNAFNRYNGDHGLFQINERYWCDPQNGKFTKNVCEMPCENLRDDDLTDDISCVRKIFAVHGFRAWAVYNSCQKQNPFSRNSFSTNECDSGNVIGNQIIISQKNHPLVSHETIQNTLNPIGWHPYSNQFYYMNDLNTIDNNLLYLFA